MGSPNEREAMDFAASKFREFGMKDVSLMPMTTVQGDALSGPANTRSGIVVGILPGATDRMIVIGAHIDSASPEIPGANDDGSGSAVVIELARVLSHRKNESTLVFCLFGGEESGLKGSKHFVEHFPSLDRVVLMLQVDMANGSEWLLPLIDQGGKSSPRWLVSAAFEEMAKLGYEKLLYPTDFFAMNNSLPGGGIGSDHMPFLDKNIPALDFTSDVNDPIHTPQDSFDLLNTKGLKRSGDLVYNLVARFDGGVPQEKTEEYYFAHIGPWLLFIPLWLVGAFLLVALLFGGLALWRERRGRVEVDKAVRPKIPGLKMFFLMIIVQACIWGSELVVGLFKGARYPWYSDISGYFFLAGLGGLVGLWIALQLIPRLHLSSDPYRYLLRSVTLLAIVLLLLSLFSVKAALYPGLALIFISLVSLIKSRSLKLLFWTFSVAVLFRFFFNEGFALFARVMPEATMTSGLGFSVMWFMFLVVFFALWFFPPFLSFAALYKQTQADMFWLNSFKRKTGIALAGSTFLICALWLASEPSYTETRKQAMRIDQHFNYNSGKGGVYIRSGDYLSKARVQSAILDTIIPGWTREFKVKDLVTPQDPWIFTARSVETEGTDSAMRVNIRATLRFKYRPLSLVLTYTAGKKGLKDAGSSLAFATTPQTVSLRWNSFPDTVMLAPVHFTVLDSDSIAESVEAVFVQPLEAVQVYKEMAHVFTRTTLYQRTTFSVPGYRREVNLKRMR